MTYIQSRLLRGRMCFQSKPIVDWTNALFLKFAFSILFLIFWDGAGYAAENLNIVPEPSNRLVPYGHFTIEEGGQYEICGAIAKSMAAYPLLPEDICALPIAEDHNFRRPLWEPVNPNAHLNLVEQILVWRRYGYSPRYGADLRGERSADVLEALGKSLEKEIQIKIRSGEIVLNRAQIDLNRDGKVDVVYRLSDRRDIDISPVLRTSDGKLVVAGSDRRSENPRPVRAIGRKITTSVCQPPNLDGVSRKYGVFVREEDNPLLHADVRNYAPVTYDIFYFRGSVNLSSTSGGGFSVYEPQIHRSTSATGGGVVLQKICRFSFKTGE